MSLLDIETHILHSLLFYLKDSNYAERNEAGEFST